MSPPTPKIALKLKEATARTGLSEATLRRAIARGSLRRVPELRHILITVDELNRFLGIGPAQSQHQK